MHERWLAGIGAGMAAGALWGLVFLAPQLLRDFTPLQLSASRYLAYGLVAAAVLAPRWRRATASLGRAEWWALVRLSLLGNLVYYVLVGAAVHWAGGPATALIVGLVPVVVMAAGSRAAGAMRLSALAAPCALCLAGVALIGWQALSREGSGGQGLGLRIAGLLCAFAALLSWSAYSVGNARWLSRRADISGRDWSLLTGVVTGALALLLAPAAFGASAPHAPADWARFWGVAALLAVFASVIGNACWNRASRLLPLTLAGQMIVFETVFALLYGFAWERRWPTSLELAAIACLLVGVVWCASAHLPRRAKA
ncbi:DMT family transporter [Stenotrophomonas sp. MMGLT7]|uniref:DMT family transporter n=1 Tax=Stenotrophomonas sp. MMGLT7 TaxID=2901227 RepID=UPI001E4AFA61|nr:DMT family transporter [Stenotrophomonas sp. MMGLT7]MCD7098180.1 DMT family transporter [Stenotrophomonas sp. MMGLT7]